MGAVTGRLQSIHRHSRLRPRLQHKRVCDQRQIQRSPTAEVIRVPNRLHTRFRGGCRRCRRPTPGGTDHRQQQYQEYESLYHVSAFVSGP
jgi:hypothetical protein